MTTSQFLFLADAESFLKSQGFHLIPDTCDWTSAAWTNAAGGDAGVYATYGRYGQVTGWRVEINPGVGADKRLTSALGWQSASRSWV